MKWEYIESKDNKTNKKEEQKNIDNRIATLNYIIASCFYFIAFMNFINNDNKTMGIVYLGLGSTYLCLATTYSNKDNKDDKENKKDK